MAIRIAAAALVIAGLSLIVTIGYAETLFFRPVYVASSKRLRVCSEPAIVRIEALDLVSIGLALAALGPALCLVGIVAPRLASVTASWVAMILAASCAAIVLAASRSLRIRIEVTAEETRVVRSFAEKITWSTTSRRGRPTAKVCGWGDLADPNELALFFDGSEDGHVLGWGTGDDVDCDELASRINAAVTALEDDLEHVAGG